MQVRKPKHKFRLNAQQTNDTRRNGKSMEVGLPSMLANMLQTEGVFLGFIYWSSWFWNFAPHPVLLIFGRPRQGAPVVEIAFSVWADSCQRRQKLIFLSMLYLWRLILSVCSLCIDTCTVHIFPISLSLCNSHHHLYKSKVWCYLIKTAFFPQYLLYLRYCARYFTYSTANFHNIAKSVSLSSEEISNLFKVITQG